MYLMTSTRPDLAAAVGIFSRFLSNPGKEHWEGLKRVLRYIKYTVDYRLTFVRKEKFLLKGYVDSDWAGCVDTSRSTTGFVFVLGGTAVSWSSKRQKCVTLSSCEAEYVAAGHATREAIWLADFLAELGEDLPGAVQIHSDSQSAISLVKNPVQHQNTKHIRIQYHFIRERYKDGEVNFKYISTKDQPADFLTKAVSREKFEMCGEFIGVKSP
jgi:hypothetical protein